MDNVDINSVKSFVDTLWVIDCAILVFIMQAGFMCMESGLSRYKNSINVALKNAADFGVSVVIFWVFGFGIMFGTSYKGLFGTDLFFLKTDIAEWMHYFVFQAMFVATAATISTVAFPAMINRGYHRNFTLGILAAGGTKKPEKLLRESGIDITKPKFWQDGFDYIQSQVKELSKLN